MIKKIEKIIFDLCEKDKKDIWENHILKVVEYSKILAKKLKADQKIVEIAALLHDIAKLKGNAEDHHIRGSQEAEQILKNMEYSEEKIKQIKECILTHSSDIKYPPKTKEAKIVATADALAIFDNFYGLAYVVYSIKKLSIEEGKKWLRNKYEIAWNKLIPEGKEIAKPKYEAIKLLLK